ncbi:hypothetical protein SVIOM342S_02862 [Streptomyces violaceorubidus]
MPISAAPIPMPYERLMLASSTGSSAHASAAVAAEDAERARRADDRDVVHRHPAGGGGRLRRGAVSKVLLGVRVLRVQGCGRRLGVRVALGALRVRVGLRGDGGSPACGAALKPA